MRFIDEVTVTVRGGRGGDGVVGWRREKYVPRGGPDGGNGGNGGAVVFLADVNRNTLLDYSFKPLLFANDGDAGASGRKDGSQGEDLLCRVPVGTQVFYEDRLIADLNTPGSVWVAAAGGTGGKGNAVFKTSTNRSPDTATKGAPGAEFTFRLVLKSVADVGLVGLPNVGKSTLISKISHATPKVADYPFTTLQPHLGVVVVDDTQNFVVADMPGIIPGAHEGKGLGIQFLKHIERTKLLVQLIDVSTAVPADAPQEAVDQAAKDQYEVLQRELRLFQEGLDDRVKVVVFSKGDLEISRRACAGAERRLRSAGKEVFLISSNTGEQLPELIACLARLLR